MTQLPETEFDMLLRSLAVPPDEAARRETLKEKIKAHVAPLFDGNHTSENYNEFCAG
jgi:hypothetical protein